MFPSFAFHQIGRNRLIAVSLIHYRELDFLLDYTHIDTIQSFKSLKSTHLGVRCRSCHCGSAAVTGFSTRNRFTGQTRKYWLLVKQD
jgi:hypothetical protein